LISSCRVGSDNGTTETAMVSNGKHDELANGNGATKNGNGHIGETEQGMNFCKSIELAT
jgi:hypothetical protein